MHAKCVLTKTPAWGPCPVHNLNSTQHQVLFSTSPQSKRDDLIDHGRFGAAIDIFSAPVPDPSASSEGASLAEHSRKRCSSVNSGDSGGAGSGC